MPKVKWSDSIEGNCGSCKSFSENFCTQWTFVIDANHIPCTKYKGTKRVSQPVSASSSELFIELLNKLKMLQREIAGRNPAEIAMMIGALISEFENRM